jgi:hypothetical protein
MHGTSKYQVIPNNLSWAITVATLFSQYPSTRNWQIVRPKESADHKAGSHLSGSSKGTVASTYAVCALAFMASDMTAALEPACAQLLAALLAIQWLAMAGS